MPDTGPPWEIPFLDGTELVRAYPAFSEDLAEQVAAGLSAAGNAGIGSNVVSLTSAISFSTSSTTFTPVTGFAIDFTPTSNSSKVFIIANFAYQSRDGIGTTRLMRNSASIAETAHFFDGRFLNTADRSRYFQTVTFLDSPNTTSPVTYSIEARTSAGSMRIGIDQVNSGQVSLSTITAIEVAA